MKLNRVRPLQLPRTNSPTKTQLLTQMSLTFSLFPLHLMSKGNLYRIRFQDKLCQLCFKDIHKKTDCKERNENNNNVCNVFWEKRALNTSAILQVLPFISYPKEKQEPKQTNKTSCNFINIHPNVV